MLLKKHDAITSRQNNNKYMEGHYRTCWIAYQAKSMDCQYAITNMVQYPLKFVERISMRYLMNQMVFNKKQKKTSSIWPCHWDRWDHIWEKNGPIGCTVSAGRLETAVCLLRNMTSETDSPVASCHRWSRSSSAIMLRSCFNNRTFPLVKLSIPSYKTIWAHINWNQNHDKIWI